MISISARSLPLKIALYQGVRFKHCDNPFTYALNYKYAPQLWNCSQTCIFKKKNFRLSCLHITSACIAGHHDTNESPQPRRSAEKVNQSDFSFVLMNPLTKIQYSLSTLTNHYYYFLFMLGTILFLGELPRLLPSPYFFFSENIYNRSISKKIDLVFMHSFVCIIFYLSY